MKRDSRLSLLTAALIIIAVTGWSTTVFGGGVYVCKGRNGGMHFTNTPTTSDCKIFQNNRKTPFSGSSRGASWQSTSQKMNYKDKVPYHSQIHDIGARYRIDPNLIRAVIRAESSFNQYAVSRTGAQGLMQLMPGTARDMNVADPFNPTQNIEGGTRYLRTLMDTFGGNITLTLAAYNAGPTVVKKVKRIPQIPETVTYVRRVLDHYKGYSRAQPRSDRSTIRVNNVVTVH